MSDEYKQRQIARQEQLGRVAQQAVVDAVRALGIGGRKFGIGIADPNVTWDVMSEGEKHCFRMMAAAVCAVVDREHSEYMHRISPR